MLVITVLKALKLQTPSIIFVQLAFIALLVADNHKLALRVLTTLNFNRPQ